MIQDYDNTYDTYHNDYDNSIEIIVTRLNIYG